jgi:hypothetical protein
VNSKAIPTCHLHPRRSAEWTCQSCNNFFCDECVEHKKVGKIIAHICKSARCRGRCVSIDAVIAQAVEFADDAGTAHLTERVQWYLRRWKTRFHIAIGLLVVVALLDIVRAVGVGDRVYWFFYMLWGMLVFGLYLRKFWAWTITAILSGFQVAVVIYKLAAHQYRPGEPLSWLYIALGYWLGAFVVLMISRPEFTE